MTDKNDFIPNSQRSTRLRDRLMGGIIGSLVGDALGVPVEFTGRSMRDANPVTKMSGFGTWNQPAGTWSDDGSMTLVTAEALSGLGWDLPNLMGGFLSWMDDAWWTPHGTVFDIGNTTRNALMLYRIDKEIAHCGGDEENSNGNGSLMRIMPISCWLFGMKIKDQIQLVGEASALTHAHIRSRLCCAWHTLWCDGIISERDVRTAARDASDRLRRHVPEYERRIFARLLDGSAMGLPRLSINSDGYVVSTMEASLWCLANHSNFSTTVLAAVNLGGDADTTGAVTGGMAGLHYGFNAIPKEWISTLARHDDVMALAERFADACLAHWQAST